MFSRVRADWGGEGWAATISISTCMKRESLESCSAYHRQDVILSAVTARGCTAATLLLWAGACRSLGVWNFFPALSSEYRCRYFLSDCSQRYFLHVYSATSYSQRLRDAGLANEGLSSRTSSCRRAYYKTINHGAIHSSHLTREGKFDRE